MSSVARKPTTYCKHKIELWRLSAAAVVALALLFLLVTGLQLQPCTQPLQFTRSLELEASRYQAVESSVRCKASLQTRTRRAISLHVASRTAQRTTADLSVMFAMIGRDVADELPYVLANIARLAAHFKDAHIVLVENNSVEDTRELFKAWGANFSAGYSNRTSKLVSFDAASGKKDLRLLAQARNNYLELLTLPEYAGVDYLVVVHTDMCFPWDVPIMVQVINDLLPAAGREWHVLYANGACGWYKNPLDLQNREEVPFYTPGSAPIYCDLFALRDTYGVEHRRDIPDIREVIFPPGTCNFNFMLNQSSATFTCKHINGHPVVPVQAAFGGWGMYEARFLRPANGNEACKHDVESGGCEHVTLSNCLVRNFNVSQLIATGLVVNWEGCSEKQQHRWDGWYPGRGPVE